jgi:tRNA (cmo5U34)-methyltransferase
VGYQIIPDASARPVSEITARARSGLPPPRAACYTACRDGNNREGDMAAADAAPAWDEESSRTFLDYGRYFVPERDRQMRIVCGLIPPPPAGARLVELCAGEGLLSCALLERFPACRVLALDGSAEMRRATLATCAAHANRLTVQPFDLAARGWRCFPEPIHAVVSSLAVHHLDGAQKRELFSDMAAALAGGGVIVIADIVRPASTRGFAIAAEELDEIVRAQARALDGHFGAFEQFERLGWNYFRAPDADPIDQPSPLLDQLKWLEAAGLVDVDVHWLVAGHAIFSGRKP